MESASKQPFPIMVRLWLNHKVVLSYHSPHYKQPDKAESLRICQDIAKIVRANCCGYNMGAICQLIRMYEKHLWNILPAQMNPSYQKQSKKLEEILTIAKNYKR